MSHESSTEESEIDDGEPRTDDSEPETAVGRRPYLGLLGAAAASFAGCMDGESDDRSNPTGTPTDDVGTTETPSMKERFGTHRGIQFDRVLDAVEDLGLDPSGEEPVEEALAEALTVPGTLILFPEGQYRFAASMNLTAERVGLLGTGTSASFPNPGLGACCSTARRSVSTTCSSRTWTSTSVRRTPRPESGSTAGTGSTSRTSSSSAEGASTTPGRSVRSSLRSVVTTVGVLRNAVAKKGSRIDGYEGGNGRIGVWVGWSNKGTVRIEGCDFREFGNNGTYTSRTPGQVEIVDSYFLNNNAASVRIGGEGATSRTARSRSTWKSTPARSPTRSRSSIRVASSSSKGSPNPDRRSQRVQRYAAARSTPADRHDRRRSSNSRPRLAASSSVTPEIQCDIDGTPAIRRGPPGSIPYRPDQQQPPKPHWTRLRNVTIGGSAAGGAAVDLRLAPESRVVDCEIVANGADRDGILQIFPR